MDRIVFTREHPLQDEWIEKLKNKGFVVEHAPLIRCDIHDVPSHVFEHMSKTDWLFLTSVVAANYFFEKANHQFKNNPCRIATIGPGTSQAVLDWGYVPEFQSEHYYAKDFAKEFMAVYDNPQKIYLPHSSLSAPLLKNTLHEHGYDVDAWVMYETVHNPIGQERIASFIDDVTTIWTFASGSAWDSFYEVQQSLPEHHKIAAIGTTTKGTIEKTPHRVNYIPEEPLIELMIQRIIDEHSVE